MLIALNTNLLKKVTGEKKKESDFFKFFYVVSVVKCGDTSLCSFLKTKYRIFATIRRT